MLLQVTENGSRSSALVGVLSGTGSTAMGSPYAERYLGLVRAHEKAIRAAMESLTADEVRSYSKEYIQKVEALPENKRAKFLDPVVLAQEITRDVLKNTVVSWPSPLTLFWMKEIYQLVHDSKP